MAKVLKVADRRRCIGCLSCRQACARLRGEFSIANSAIEVKTSGGYTGEFVINICRGCEEPACMEACKFGALTKRNGGGVIFHKDKCTKCGACGVACAVNAIRFDEEGYPIICTHCGYCTKYCPHRCITTKEVL
ncbi:4Fe-4S binding protein [Thermobrachium celere]|uniref:Iron-sulfur cluster binding protein n=1 Tax=Thermobrachium celere DSM 8682 TaxID=941824 RepID=R7RR58_9CLOT|nr:4Fe-4S dicluster domain-containing protein [Thermobrachium celere]GFR34347.1 iron-sulfur-binding protein [Thermobrachium celere]CDF58514.1 iron-sulfur cluster binding protein [Thermobrachium celere DSM 8682]